MRFIPRSEEVAKTCILAVALGAVFRICPFIGRDFPVNDGGLWLRFTDALGNADFILPSAVEWNGSLLPLVYPPLGIYILAGANRVTGIEVEKLLCWIPLILSLTSIPCFVFFSYAFLPSKRAAQWATYLFALIPSAFYFFIMGGGVPRGLGLCFTLLAWGSATGIAHSKRPFRDGTILGLLCALAALSHPVAMYWSILGAAAIAMESSSAESTKILLFSLFITVITILPWLGWCTWNHGLVPFVSAAQTRSSQFDLLQLFMRLSFLTRFLGPLPWVSVLALIGTLYLLAIGRPALFLLTILFCVFDISGFETFGSGIIASVGAAGALAGISDGLYKSAAAHSRYAKASLAALGILFLFSSAAGTLREISASPSPLTSPSRTQVASLRTFFLQFPPSAKFVVIADSKISGDALPEWFMTITGRRVINLHQGMEWRGEFSENYKLLKDLQGLCRGREVSGQLHERFTALAADYAVIDRRSCKYLDYRWRARRSDALAAEDPDFSVFMFDRVKDELPDEEQ